MSQTPYLSPFTFNARIASVQDGDTLNVVVDRGMYEYAGSTEKPVPVRLLGCNAWELSTPAGAAAKANLAALLPPGTPVILSTAKPDKFAPRWDAAVTFAQGGVLVDLVTYLIAGQWLSPWNGQGTKPLPPWPRTVTA